MSSENYITINKDSWNKRTEHHINSVFYDNESFLAGRNSLNSIELELLGDIRNKKILHLQCHFGQDTISLARLGASSVGVDLSDKAIDLAKKMSTNENARFVCSDIYDLPKHLNEEFDIIFTSYGTIGWLPNLNKWGEIINQFLKSKGKFVFVEFHPIIWAYDYDFEKIKYNYFNEAPIEETLDGSYADDVSDNNYKSISWNHPISDVVNSLIKNGLSINTLNEYDYSPYNCFRNTVEFEKGKFRIKSWDNKMPMVYSIVATKK